MAIWCFLGRHPISLKQSFLSIKIKGSGDLICITHCIKFNVLLGFNPIIKGELVSATRKKLE